MCLSWIVNGEAQVEFRQSSGNAPWARPCSSETAPGALWWRFPGPCLRWCFRASRHSGKAKWAAASPLAHRRCRPHEPPHRGPAATPSAGSKHRYRYIFKRLTQESVICNLFNDRALPIYKHPTATNTGKNNKSIKNTASRYAERHFKNFKRLERRLEARH